MRSCSSNFAILMTPSVCCTHKVTVMSPHFPHSLFSCRFPTLLLSVLDLVMCVKVCTSLAARGVDIPDVSHVVNFDAPTEGNDYIHRQVAFRQKRCEN